MIKESFYAGIHKYKKILLKLLKPEEKKRSSDLTLKRQSTKYKFVFSTPHYAAPPPSSLRSHLVAVPHKILLQTVD